jgi:hypothetical protein
MNLFDKGKQKDTYIEINDNSILNFTNISKDTSELILQIDNCILQLENIDNQLNLDNVDLLINEIKKCIMSVYNIIEDFENLKITKLQINIAINIRKAIAVDLQKRIILFRKISNNFNDDYFQNDIADIIKNNSCKEKLKKLSDELIIISNNLNSIILLRNETQPLVSNSDYNDEELLIYNVRKLYNKDNSSYQYCVVLICILIVVIMLGVLIFKAIDDWK